MKLGNGAKLARECELERLLKSLIAYLTGVLGPRGGVVAQRSAKLIAYRAVPAYVVYPSLCAFPRRCGRFFKSRVPAYPILSQRIGCQFSGQVVAFFS